MMKKLISGLVLLAMLACLVLPAAAAEPTALPMTVAEAVDGVSAYCTAAMQAAGTYSDWSILQLARSGNLTDAMRQDYLASLAEKLRACGGMLDKSYYTQYSRTILALTDRAGQLMRELTDLCGSCEGCTEGHCTFRDADIEELIRPAVTVPDWAREEADIAPDAKLDCHVDEGSGVITVCETFYDHDLSDIPAELLEALEASTFALPDSLGGFPQIAGMNISIDATKKYDPQTTPYPSGSGKATYYGPASINRVTINSVNGKAFDPNKTYAVVTNNFCAAGGDTYYAFAAASSQFDTGLPLDEVLMDYITTELKGVVGEQYAQPQGRMTITLPAEEPTTPTTPTKPESPKTADNGVVVYGLVAVMAAGAVVVMTSKKRKAI